MEKSKIVPTKLASSLTTVKQDKLGFGSTEKREIANKKPNNEQGIEPTIDNELLEVQKPIKTLRYDICSMHTSITQPYHIKLPHDPFDGTMTVPI